MQPSPQVMEPSTLCPYTQVEMVDLGPQFWKKPLESMSVWLLYLWDVGVDGIILSRLEMGKLASLIIHPCPVAIITKCIPDLRQPLPS